jgi:hypothetical protein
MPHLETFATTPEICKYISGDFQGAKPFESSTPDGEGQGGRDLARKLSRKQGRRPRASPREKFGGGGGMHFTSSVEGNKKVKHFDA